MVELNLPIFKDLNPDDLDHETTVIESCCMSCFKNASILMKKYTLKHGMLMYNGKF